MNDEERNAIINSGLKLKKAYPQPLFLYTSFIKDFNWNELETVVSWYTHNAPDDPVARDNSIWQTTYQDSNNINQMALQFLTQTYKLIFRTAENLESLFIDTTYLLYLLPDFTSSFHTPFILAKLKKVKLSLNYDEEEWENNTENLRDLINALKLVSRNIRILEISTNVLELSNIHQLCDLLKFQHNLEDLILENIRDEHVSIIHTLQQHQAKSLVYLEFRYSSLAIWTVTLLKKLEIFTRMEGIAFMSCRWNSRHENSFIDWWTELSQFPTSLNRLYFNCTAINDKIVIPLIKIVGNNLKELVVRNDCTQQLFEVIAEHAKNISSLELGLEVASAPFLQTIISLQSLQHLSLRSAYLLSDDFLIELSKNMKPNTKFYCASELTPHVLASFLSNRIKPTDYHNAILWPRNF
ncbi:5400_t:CDS:1 [Ambispora gerdemannii]|uniref:5400_t:CDS:1 n=1 Tax=Ambispora gerdemannii TaxID=144530 RepID=A0A9N9BK11_9GLOM|nr:5400_t:CDS:1 [Ambispora gerdemannii]